MATTTIPFNLFLSIYSFQSIPFKMSFVITVNRIDPNIKRIFYTERNVDNSIKDDETIYYRYDDEWALDLFDAFHGFVEDCCVSHDIVNVDGSEFEFPVEILHGDIDSQNVIARIPNRVVDENVNLMLEDYVNENDD